jgi:16S rRNA (guanine966-N2)-methyltransferase
MRVIAGSAKAIRLQAVPGEGTRPITDRVKESLYNILSDTVIDAQVLDLFAGTGGVGIEALSRGASRAVFVEKHKKAVRCIRENLKRTKLSASAQVVQADVFKFLARQPEPFDLVYIAPPQYLELWSKTLLLVDANPEWLAPDGVVVVQIFPKEHQELELANLELTDQRKYGSTLLCFYEPPLERPLP